MNFPLKLYFKIIALAPQIYVKDPSGKEQFFVHQKLFKLKEDVLVFSDSNKTNQTYRITADRIIDWSPVFTINDSTGNTICKLKRHGNKSLWNATYDILINDQPLFRITEKDPLIKVADWVLSGIPIIGMFAGLFLHPTYMVKRTSADNNTPSIIELRKQRSFLERIFNIEKIDNSLAEKEETQITLSLLMIVLLERTRG